MGIDISTYRFRIGTFHCYTLASSANHSLGAAHHTTFCYALLAYLALITVFLSQLLLLAGDIESNPGPDISSHDRRENQIKLMHLNIWSLPPKVPVLETEASNYDIIAVTETHLDNSVTQEALSLTGFSDPLRRDRNRQGGGIAVYAKKDIHLIPKQQYMDPRFENIWTEVITNRNRFLLGVIYRPPDSDDITWEYMSQCLEEILIDYKYDIIIVGDLNDNLLNNGNSVLQAMINNYGLIQVITEPTRITPTSRTLLDPVITNNEHLIQSSGVLDPICSDHCPTYATLRFYKPNRTYRKHIWKYDDGDYASMNMHFLNTNWDHMLDTNNTEKAAELVAEKINNIAKENIPNSEITIRPKDPPWLTNSIRMHIRKRNRKHKRAKLTNRQEHWSAFRQQRNKVIAEIRKAKKEFPKKTARKLEGEITPKKWWAVVNTLLRGNSSKCDIPFILEGHLMISDDKEKAELFNDYFISQTRLDDSCPTPLLAKKTISNLTEIVLTEQEVIEAMQSLKPSKSAGIDEIHNRILKECAHSLCYPLCQLFNKSLHIGTYPELWKLANVVPIYKNGERHDKKNYRPISLLSCIGKLMERCVSKHILQYLIKNNIVTTLQSGFKPGDSTVNQMIDIYHTIASAIDNGKEVRSVFCDISKAFDRVWHQGLLSKLHSIGIRGKLLLWLQSYLQHRKQRVFIHGKTSQFKELSAGVPQGSVLGPLLFIIFINDIVEEITCNIRLFADDTSLSITVEDPESAARIINEDLNKIHAWATKWLVTFNPTKTKTVTFSTKRVKVDHPPLKFGGTTLEQVQSHKHLGIVLSADCKWKQHVDHICSKAGKALNALRKLKYILDRRTLEQMYDSYIQPLLDYGDTIWCGITQTDQCKIEAIHLEAARIITGAPRGTSHSELYTELFWKPLWHRQKWHVSIQLYKMIKHLTPPYLSNMVPRQNNETHGVNLRNANHLRHVAARTNILYNSFLPQSVRHFNSLPNDVKESNTVNEFKRKTKPTVNCQDVYYLGNRVAQIAHACMRMKYSKLNADMYRRHLIDIPTCHCGMAAETAEHYLLYCSTYDQQRTQYIHSLTIPLTIDILLYGSPDISTHLNHYIFNGVHRFINATNRFQ